jgi:voltage-gated potassium channel
LAFLKWGWIDLIASIPNLPILRVGRLVRILRIIRLLRAIRATHKITALLLKDKIKTGVTSVVLTSFLLVMFCSIGILICEQQNPDANIKTAKDDKGQKAHKLKNRDTIKSLKILVKIQFFLVKKEWW